MAFVGTIARRRGLVLAWAFSLAVTASLLVTFDLDLQATWRAVRTIDPAWLVVAVVSHYAAFLLRATRWRLFLSLGPVAEEAPAARQPILYLATVILMSFFVNSVMWLRAGDIYRGVAYAADTGQSLARTAAAVVMDRLADLFTIAAFVFLALLLIALGGSAAPDGVLGAAVLLTTLLVLGVTATLILRRKLPYLLPNILRAALGRFQSGMTARWEQVPMLTLLSVGAWSLVVVRLYCVTQALGADISLGLILLVPLANVVLTAVPIVPGGIGIAEAGISGLLRTELVLPVAVAVTLVDRSISYLSVVVSGGALFGGRQLGLRYGLAVAYAPSEAERGA